jgi:hypothetical protein
MRSSTVPSLPLRLVFLGKGVRVCFHKTSYDFLNANSSVIWLLNLGVPLLQFGIKEE